MKQLSVLLFVVLLAACRPESGTHPPPTASPYAGDETRAIKALSPEQVEEYLTGAGMGLARTAELNAYPGPRHVLDLADELGLSGDQRARTRAVFETMDAEARRIGRLIVDGEQALDARFAAGEIDEAGLEQALATLASLQGELRFVHLQAHLQMKTILTPEQVHRYDTLRGYTASKHDGAHPHAM